LAAGGGVHAVTIALQGVEDELAHAVLVLDDQDPCRGRALGAVRHLAGVHVRVGQAPRGRWGRGRSRLGESIVPSAGVLYRLPRNENRPAGGGPAGRWGRLTPPDSAAGPARRSSCAPPS